MMIRIYSLKNPFYWELSIHANPELLKCRGKRGLKRHTWRVLDGPPYRDEKPCVE